MEREGEREKRSYIACSCKCKLRSTSEVKMNLKWWVKQSSFIAYIFMFSASSGNKVLMLPDLMLEQC